MPFTFWIIRLREGDEGVGEIARTMKSGGLFYCSLISGDETGYPSGFSGEVVVIDPDAATHGGRA